jgi:hypothetical protein
MSEVKNKSEHQNNSATPVQAPKEASSLGETEYVDARASTFQYIQLQAAADDQGKGNRITQLQSKASQFTTFSQVAQLQAKRDSKMSSAHPHVVQREENKTGLPDGLKSGMESISGFSLDDVKVYRNSDKPAQLQAYAYAQGTNIHLGPGQEKHLPHELGHVVQQKQGRVKATTQLKGTVSINDNDGLETEADLLGNKALAFAGNENTTLQKKAIPNINIAQLKKWKDGHELAASDPDFKQHRPRWVEDVSPPAPAKQEPAPAPAPTPAPGPADAGGVAPAPPVPVPATAPTPTPAPTIEKTYSDADRAKVDAEIARINKESPDLISDQASELIGSIGDGIKAETTQYTVKELVDGEEKEVTHNLDGTKEEARDPGDAEKAAGILASIGSSVAFFVQVQNLRTQWSGSSNWEKAGLASEVAESGMRVGASVSSAVENSQEADKAGSGELAKQVGEGMGLADGLSAIKNGVQTIYKIYQAYNEAKDAAEYSQDEKNVQKAEILQGLIETAGKTVSTIKGIADMIGQGSGPLASAVPGLGAALSAVDLAIGIYEFIKTRKIAAEMKKMAEEAIAAKDAKSAEVYNHLLKQNQDKVKKLGVTIGLDFVSVVGNIAACIPEPNSQIAGLSLKIIAGGGKALMNAIMWGKQKLNNMAAENPTGTVAKLFGNADQSSEKIAERNKKTVDLIAESIEPSNLKIEDVKNDPKEALKLKASVIKTEALIKGAGTDPMAVYREMKGTSFEKGMALIYQNMPKS